MFPLSHMLKSFVQKGTLKVIDADGNVHVFAGTPGPSVTMRLTDRSLYRKLFFNPELHELNCFHLRDYRDVNERFDRIVSVGMFEHVGVHHYAEFFAKINALMHDEGLML